MFTEALNTTIELESLKRDDSGLCFNVGRWPLWIFLKMGKFTWFTWFLTQTV